MFDNPKFIITKYHGALIFPAHITHAEFARKFVDDLSEVKSAGFVSFDMNNVPRPYGKSVSLKIGISDMEETKMDIWKTYAPQVYEDVIYKREYDNTN